MQAAEAVNCWLVNTAASQASVPTSGCRLGRSKRWDLSILSCVSEDVVWERAGALHRVRCAAQLPYGAETSTSAANPFGERAAGTRGRCRDKEMEG